MNDFWAGFVCGLMMFMLLSVLPFSDSSIYRTAKEECEKNLPRNQHCKIVGVPVEGNP
jgi:hypothetical protein